VDYSVNGPGNRPGGGCLLLLSGRNRSGKAKKKDGDTQKHQR
jgi:hypothetical protein